MLGLRLLKGAALGFGEEDMVERTISVHQNLVASAANVFELRHRQGMARARATDCIHHVLAL